MVQVLRVGLVIIFLLFCANKSNAVPSLQQTEPLGNVDVCPGGVLQYTCIAENGLIWTASDAPNMPVQYTILLSMVNDSGPAGVFNTKLVDISSTMLTSTATIKDVSLEDNGKNISCRDLGSAVPKEVQIQEPPFSPSNLTAIILTNAGNDKATVNLTWSVISNNCVVLYQVEGNSPISSISMNTTTQYSELLLNIGEEYSFRVRGVDTADRLGDWSTIFMYTPMIISSTLPISTPTTQIPTPTPTTNVAISTTIPITASSKGVTMTSQPTMTTTPMGGVGGLSAGEIAGIVVGVLAAVTVVLIAAIIITTTIIIIKCRRKGYDIPNEDNNIPNHLRGAAAVNH